MENIDPAEKIASFGTVTLRETARGSVEYEITARGDEAEITRYVIRYSDGKEQRVPEERAMCPAEKALTLLNECALLSWDGFDGPHPEGVLDGIMFRLEAIVNGGRKVRASGSECFPEGYRVFTRGLYELLRAGEG